MPGVLNSQSFLFLSFFFFLLIDWLIYLWLCWVFVSVQGLSLVAASGGHSSSRCAGLSLSWPLLLRSTGSRHAGSVVVAHGPSRSAACGIFPDQGSNPYPLRWQADSQPLRHQGSPFLFLNLSDCYLKSTSCLFHLHILGLILDWLFHLPNFPIIHCTSHHLSLPHCFLLPFLYSADMCRKHCSKLCGIEVICAVRKVFGNMGLQSIKDKEESQVQTLVKHL